MSDKLSWALRYATKLNWFVFPLHSLREGKCSCGSPECDAKNQGKHPRIKGGVLSASNDPKVIGLWWEKWPDANIGLACKPSRVVVVDIDPRNDGDNTLVALERDQGTLPVTPTQLTGGGGLHYIYARPDVDTCRGTTIPDGIDVKADGGYIVLAPSNHLSGRDYTWDAGRHIGDIPIAPLPTFIANILRARSEEKTSNEIPVDMGFLGAAFTAAGWAGRDLGNGRLSVQCPWESEHSSGMRYDGSTVVFAPNEGRNTGWFWCSHSHCQTKRKFKDVIKKLPVAAKKAAYAKLGIPDGKRLIQDNEAAPTSEESQPWTASLTTNSDGFVTSDWGNAALFLTNLPEWKGALRFDEFAGRARWMRPTPVVEGLERPVVGSELSEPDLVYVTHWLSIFRRVKFQRMAIVAALDCAAKSNSCNPAREYFESLKWDGTPRLDTWIPKYVGSDDTIYNRLVGRWWVISAVARVFKPGCQVDHVLILSGPQGARKSSLLIALAGAKWTLESMPQNLAGKDSISITRGKLVCIFNELESLRSSSVEVVKDYIVRRTDVYRPTYAQFEIEVPRQCVFAGTANDEYCLPVDGSGNRRFWPVNVPSQISLEIIAELESNRDQIWAEAAHRYLAGEMWYPSTVVEHQIVGRVQDASVEEDPWTLPVMRWTDAHSGVPFSTDDVLFQALCMPKERHSRSFSIRVGILLRKLGFRPKQVRRDGGRVRLYSRNWTVAQEMYGYRAIGNEEGPSVQSDETDDRAGKAMGMFKQN